MQRELKKSYHCSYCKRQGIGLVLQSYDNNFHQWYTDTSTIPEGWVNYEGYLLCEYCSDDPKAEATINRWLDNNEKKKNGRYAAIVALISGLIAVFILFAFISTSDNISVGNIGFFLGTLLVSILLFIYSFKKNLGCTITAIAIILLPLILYILTKILTS